MDEYLKVIHFIFNSEMKQVKNQCVRAVLQQQPLSRPRLLQPRPVQLHR